MTHFLTTNTILFVTIIVLFNHHIVIGSLPLLPFFFSFFIFYFLLPIHHRLLHLSIDEHRAVMMHHEPMAVMELINICYVKWPSVHVNEGFHCDPSHVCKHPSSHIPHLEVHALVPVEGKLPALYYCIVTVRKKNYYALRHGFKHTL